MKRPEVGLVEASEASGLKEKNGEGERRKVALRMSNCDQARLLGSLREDKRDAEKRSSLLPS